jgi:hypothetical protein
MPSSHKHVNRRVTLDDSISSEDSGILLDLCYVARTLINRARKQRVECANVINNDDQTKQQRVQIAEWTAPAPRKVAKLIYNLYIIDFDEDRDVPRKELEKYLARAEIDAAFALINSIVRTDEEDDKVFKVLWMKHGAVEVGHGDKGKYILGHVTKVNDFSISNDGASAVEVERYVFNPVSGYEHLASASIEKLMEEIELFAERKGWQDRKPMYRRIV